MGVSRAVQTVNNAEYTNSTFVDNCNDLGIRRELTAPYTLQQNGPAGHAVRVAVNKLFPDIHLKRLKEVRDPGGTSLRLESVIWACEGFNRSAPLRDDGERRHASPHKVFYGGRLSMPVLPFCKPACHRNPRRRKMNPQVRPCFFLNFGFNHGSGCFKVMDAETGMVVHLRDVTWH